ncbi:Peptidase A1 [Macleaya cordata]|uniref:Peptidase A1 n=1 Tax=Macleaya cordata TaxID=56857 RepID=A0A200R9R7_MACCD|nr:Peptidase A1 [Macleaya cordata]
MLAILCAWFLVLFSVFLILPGTVVFCGFPATLTLERNFPANERVELGELRARDRARHGRILQSFSGVIDFPVHVIAFGVSLTVLLYFTRVKLGSPPREFYVQIDTGSDVLWVACNQCNGCPKSSGLNLQLGFFDPYSSASASLIPCSAEICALAIPTTETGCSSQNPQCSYSFQYEDGSGTSGYYVSDILYFDSVIGDSMIVNSSARVIFGCSNYQSGDLTKQSRAVDGIFGFGQHYFSVISQLSSGGIVPKVFSHCLNGKDYGGGVLVLGEILEPGIVYSPLVPSQPHYNLNLLSIAVNEQILPIDPAVFATSSNEERGTIVDSGTTLAYLAEEAYDPFVNSITNAVSQSARPMLSEDQCFVISSSVDEIFPQVTLNFEGGASMVLKPRDYLVQKNYIDGTALWCIGFQKEPGRGLTILGDLVLKDKIVVYDLARQRLGWVNYDCSSTVNVSSTSGKDYITGQLSVSSSSGAALCKLIPTSSQSLPLYILFAGFLLL